MKDLMCLQKFLVANSQEVISTQITRWQRNNITYTSWMINCIQIWVKHMNYFGKQKGWDFQNKPYFIKYGPQFCKYFSLLSFHSSTASFLSSTVYFWCNNMTCSQGNWCYIYDRLKVSCVRNIWEDGLSREEYSGLLNLRLWCHVHERLVIYIGFKNISS